MYRCTSYGESYWETVNPGESLLGAQRCQELDQNNADYSWRSARETADISQAVKTTDGHFSTNTSRSTIPLTDEPKVVLGQVWLHLHFSTIRSGDESIRAAQCNTCDREMCQQHSPRLYFTKFKLIHNLRRWDAQMESTFHPQQSATYSEGELQLPIGLAGWVQVDILPLPALVIHAFTLWGKKEGHKPRHEAAEKGTVFATRVADSRCGYDRGLLFQQGKLFSSSVIITTRWHWSASYARNSTYWQVQYMQCNMLHWDLLKLIIRQQTDCGQDNNNNMPPSKWVTM